MTSSPPMSPTSQHHTTTEVTGPLSSADRKEVLRLVDGYGRWWDHIRFRKGWATPHFERDAEVDNCLKRAAEYVVRIRRWVDGKQEGQGMRMRLLEGLSHEYFWSIEDWQPEADQARFIKELVHATLKDGRGYVDGLDEKQVDDKMRLIDEYWATLPSHHPQNPQNTTQNSAPEELSRRLKENVNALKEAAEQITLDSLSSQSNRSRLQSVCTLLSRAESLLKSITHEEGSEEGFEQHEERISNKIPSQGTSFGIPQSETQAQTTFSLDGVDTVASPTTATAEQNIPDVNPNTEASDSELSPTKTGVAGVSASPTVEHVETPQDSETEAGEDAVEGFTQRTQQQDEQQDEQQGQQQDQQPPLVVEDVEDENETEKEGADEDEDEDDDEAAADDTKVSEVVLSPTSRKSVTVSSVADDEEVEQMDQTATGTAEGEKQASEQIEVVPPAADDGGLKKDDSVKLTINKVHEDVITKEKEVQHLLQDCEQIDLNVILENATQGEKVIEGLQKRALYTSEVLMKDLLTLDQLTCATPESRQQRKEQVRQIQEIMDIVDDLSQKLRDLQTSVHARRKAEEEERKKHEEAERKRLEEEAKRARQQKRQKLHDYIDQELPEIMGDLEEWKALQIEPRFQTTERPREYIVAARIPGMNKRDVDISLTNDNSHLIVSGLRVPTRIEAVEIINNAHHFVDEGKYDDIDESSFDAAQILLPAAGGRFGHFRQSYKLPSDAAPSEIEGSYDSGLLQIVIPKHHRPSALPGHPRSRSPYGDPFSSLLGGSRNDFLDMFAPHPQQYDRRPSGGNPFGRSRTGFW